MHRHIRLSAALLAAPFALVACGDGPTAAGDAGHVTIGFSTAPSPSSSPSSFDGALAPASLGGSADELVLAGGNGTLTITDVRFIVNEFKLERDEAACEGLDGAAEDACEKFETGLAFVDLPLSGATAPIVTQAVPAGTYLEMKFEVEDVDLDEADDDDDAEIQALLQQIHGAGFTDWPEDASLVVVGTFTPAGGEPRGFTAYFEAEIKVEMEFDPALVIDGESGTVDVEIDPGAWFTNADGTVVDLSAFDFATSGEVIEFEAKMENGFRKVELEGFDD